MSADAMMAEYLRSIARYCADTGMLIRTASTSPRARAGAALASKNAQGYLTACVKSRVYYVHRLIWLYHYGCWPNGMIDHINQNKSDNRIENLREASPSLNASNGKVKSTNTTGVTGVVTRKKNNGIFLAQCQRDRVMYRLGSFSTVQAAADAVDKFRREHDQWGKANER